jgi:methionine sulfoxide reductase heme-binding subunit
MDYGNEYWGGKDFMDLINERQHFPFIAACTMAVMVIGAAFLITHFVDPSPAAVNKTYWYLERSAGFTSYGLLSLTVLLGMSSTSSFWDKWKMRKLMTQMHQYAALLVFPFLFFHLWGLYMDKTIPFHISQLLVPFTSSYRAIPTGFGTLTLYAWLLIIISSYFREKIGLKMWRTIHKLAFFMFIGVTFHGMMSGTDSSRHLVILVYAVPSVLFLFFGLLHIRKKRASVARH